jgi:hypothetical protein
MTSTTVEEFALKEILGIGKQPNCFLVNFCNKQSIECEGHRAPWCKLEVLIKENKCSKLFLKKLKNTKIITLLDNTRKCLNDTAEKESSLLSGEKSFSCPFFRESIKVCDFNICPYFSKIIGETNCLLSVSPEKRKNIPLSELAVAKNIPRNRLLKLIFNIEIGEKWEQVETLLIKGQKRIAVCPSCGHFQSTCHNDKDTCLKRSTMQETIKDESLVPDRFFKYPMILVLLVVIKIFGEWHTFLFSKKTLKLYLDNIVVSHV